MEFSKSKELSLVLLRLLSVTQLRIPVLAASVWRQIQNRPQRGDVGSQTRVFARIGHIWRHLGGPEQPHFIAVALEHSDRRPFRAVAFQRPDILGVVVADGLYEIQIAPAALL